MKTLSAEPLNNKELIFLEEILIKYGNDDSILSVSELDGFLTNIISGPDTIQPSQWLPIIWGGHSNEPEWETEQEFKKFMELLFQHMNSIARLLMDAPELFEALFLFIEVDGKEIPIVEDWCIGYTRGLAEFDWPLNDDEIRLLCTAIAANCSDEMHEHMENHTADDMQEHINIINHAAVYIHQYWLKKRTPMPALKESIRKTQKIGRNEPCHCGSGKKYKHCCLH